MGVEDGSYAVYLVGVALAGGREGLGVEDVEPVLFVLIEWWCWLEGPPL